MRFAQIRNMDISNGEGIGVALFVQGCHFHCYNCFNSDTWNFNDGNEWTEETKSQFLKLIDKSYVKRVSILGGEPLADENINTILELTKVIRTSFKNISIWLYSGYKWEEIMYPVVTDDFDPVKYESILKRQNIVSMCDVIIDGRYIDSQRDLNLKWRGSKNQRVIDIKKSLENGEVILWTV